MIWNIWRCPGGICPELKTDDMTQPVGVDKNGKLWTEPTTIPEELTQEIDDLSNAVDLLNGDVSDIGDDVDDLDDRVTALENAPAGQGNLNVIHNGVVTMLTNNTMSVTYPDLPTGAFIDKIEWECFVSGGTTPRIVTMYPYQWRTDKFVSTGEGSSTAYATWDVTYSNPLTGYTELKAALDSNTLFNPAFNNTGDSVSWAHLYYHIPG